MRNLPGERDRTRLLLWPLAGGAVSFVGLVFPTGLVVLGPLVWLMARRTGSVPGWGAFAAGIGVTLLLVGIGNLGSAPCPNSGHALTLSPFGPASVECGGADPLPWLVCGVLLLVAGGALAAVSRHRA
ncbi:MAG: hypothetical protein HY240_07490 [Actinobacteria bacterium]|nr:hypothetical protein [Actinomycetota bacterium]